MELEDIDHSKARTKSPQSNGICERFHKTVLDEFYRVTFRKKVCGSLEELQKDLDLCLTEYNEQRVHSGKYCYGKTPIYGDPSSHHPTGESKNVGCNRSDSCITKREMSG